jgi:hypothetical protein
VDRKRRRPTLSGMSRVRRAILAASLVLTGCSADDSSSSRPTATPSEATDPATQLADLDTTEIVVPRAPFCDRISPEAVTTVLGEEPGDASAHRSGQRVKVSDGVADVVHEFGCRWTAGDDAAEAWVFAPPVTPQRARALVAQVDRRRGCEAGETPAFGRPTAACARRVEGHFSMSYYGLFGDAWLSCSLSLSDEPKSTVADRAAVWCAAVATGASAAG